MENERFDSLARRLSTRRSALFAGLGSLLGLAAGDTAVSAKACSKSQKRCGKRCIPKRSCCSLTQRRCGNRCVPKRSCCPGTEKRCGTKCVRASACCPGTKRCGGACIPASQCCTDAECGAFKICAGGRCITGQGTCTATADWCRNTGAFNDCDLGSANCVCFITSTGASRCGSRQFLSPLLPCLNDVECAALFPNLPGVFCANGGSGENCFSGTRCMAPCPE